MLIPVEYRWQHDLRQRHLAQRQRTLRRHTKGGWKAILNNLMTACEAAAKERKQAFRKFSLQDCRPKGVSDKLEAGHTDTQDATLHSDGKTIPRIYDRRQARKAKPAA